MIQLGRAAGRVAAALLSWALLFVSFALFVLAARWAWHVAR